MALALDNINLRMKVGNCCVRSRAYKQYWRIVFIKVPNQWRNEASQAMPQICVVVSRVSHFRCHIFWKVILCGGFSQPIIMQQHILAADSTFE